VSPRALVPAMALLLFAGCEPDEVLIQVNGTLYGCEDADVCDTVADAPVQLIDLADEVRAEDTTDSDGDFDFADVPGNSVVFTVAESWPEYVPTVFLGITGSQDGGIPDGSVFVLPIADAEELATEFESEHTFDQDTDDEGGIARGTFYHAIEGFEVEDWPGADSLSCQFEDADANVYPCVYYDADGEPDPTLDTTTFDGRWAAFDLPTGLLTGVVLDGVATEATQYALFYAYVVEDGITIYDVFPSPF
jgi:hypothetical protein